MNKQAMEILEYDKIKETLKNFALSNEAKEMINRLTPYVDINIIRRYMEETTEARAIVDITSSIPIHSLNGMKNIEQKLEKGEILQTFDLEALSSFIHEGSRLKRFMKNKEDMAPSISSYALSISELNDLADEIDRCIRRGRVDDKASTMLSKIRKRILVIEERIKSKLDNYVENNRQKGYANDSFVCQRDGRYVIPVKSQYKSNINGNVLDMSRTGSTVFIEPTAVKKLQDELNSLKIKEENEIYKILSTLTGLVFNYKREISINMETMINYDFLFAKAKYSKSIDGTNVKLNTNHYININKGRHPLLGSSAIPLDFKLGDKYNNLVITGPNTGGKTVVLKTVGLLTMIVQSGLHVPVSGDSEFSVFIDILADIGDGQSIEQNLSTFSSHIKNIITIMKCADEDTMVILDEIGAGTDPGEGMGIGIAVLEELYKKRATTIATTHYSEIKEFAKNHEGFINGCMDFDINTLKPLYRLRIGRAGDSNAFLIALRLGMDKKLIERAHVLTYNEKKEYDSYNFKDKSVVDSQTIEDHVKQIKKKKNARKRNAVVKKQKQKPKFKIGDCVYISTMDRTGIVCELENNRGEIGVMVMKKKFKINHKRLTLYIEGDELYPEDYDFDVIFKSKEYRKKDKIMSKRHVSGLEINLSKEDI